MKFSHALSIKMIILCSTTLIGANPVKEPSKTITIENNTDQTLNLNLPIPAQTIAFIQMKKLGKSQQELQDMLHTAILKDSAEEIEQAVQTGADVNMEKENKSPLLKAVLLRKSDAINALLDLGAVVNKNIVQHAIDLKSYAIACALTVKGNLDKNNLYFYAPGQRKNENSRSLFYILVAHNQLQEVEYLLRQRPDFIEGHWDTLVSVLISTIRSNHTKEISVRLLRLMIERGYDVNNIWNNPNLNSVIKSTEILNFFIAAGANPNTIIDVPLPNLPRRMSASTWKITPLLKTIELGSIESARALIKAGADINQLGNVQPTDKPSTPLSYAIEYGRTDIVALLLEHGASL